MQQTSSLQPRRDMLLRCRAAITLARHAHRRGPHVGEHPHIGRPLCSSASDSASDSAGTPTSLNASRSTLESELTAVGRCIHFVDPIDDQPKEPSKEDSHQLQLRLGYSFRNRWLLRLALVHSSAAPATHNARLAWVGDAALQMVVTEAVAAAPGAAAAPLRALDVLRQTLVARQSCEAHARQLGLGAVMVVGRSCRIQFEQGAEPELVTRNMLAECFEAVLGAVYVDGGLGAVRRLYHRHFPLPPDLLRLAEAPLGGSGAESGAAGARAAEEQQQDTGAAAKAAATKGGAAGEAPAG